MKKLILTLLILFVLSTSVRADIKDEIGAECLRILYIMRKSVYPKVYDNFKSRNSQFWALEKCLEIYKNEGGKREELDHRYLIANIGAGLEYDNCIATANETKKTSEDCFEKQLNTFSVLAAFSATTLKTAYCKTEENKELCKWLELQNKEEMLLLLQQPN